MKTIFSLYSSTLLFLALSLTSCGGGTGGDGGGQDTMTQPGTALEINKDLKVTASTEGEAVFEFEVSSTADIVIKSASVNVSKAEFHPNFSCKDGNELGPRRNFCVIYLSAEPTEDKDYSQEITAVVTITYEEDGVLKKQEANLSGKIDWVNAAEVEEYKLNITDTKEQKPLADTEDVSRHFTIKNDGKYPILFSEPLVFRLGPMPEKQEVKYYENFSTCKPKEELKAGATCELWVRISKFTESATNTGLNFRVLNKYINQPFTATAKTAS